MRHLLAALLLAVPAIAFASGGYFRFPALHGDTIAFTAEGDLWQVGVAGGRASRITTHAGLESHAAFSPDGRRLAYTGTYDGTTEVYVMPSAGGLPRRLTWLGGRVAVTGWTPQGEVMFATTAYQPLRDWQLAAVNPDTLAVRRIALDQGTDGVFSDAGTLYFTRLGLSGDNVRAYRGGAMASVWKWDEKSGTEAVRLTPASDGGNQRPMPWGSRLIVLSDRTGVMNLWSLGREGDDAKPLTKHADFEVREASISGDRVAYRHGADIRLLDLKTGVDRRVPIELASDFDQQRERWIRKPLEHFTGLAISSNGERVAIAARGRVVTAGTGTLRRVDVAAPAASRARGATFMPDGRQVLALSDASGEFELWLFPADGSGPGRQLTRDGDAQRWFAVPSPDGRWAVHADIRARLWLTEIATGKTELLDQMKGGSDNAFRGVTWSPDSAAIAAVVDEPGARDVGRIVLYRLADRKRVDVTSARYPGRSPVFSPDGKWLWFVGDRTLVAQPGNPWGDRNMGPAFDKRGKFYAVALQPGLRFPFQPKDELEGAKPAAAATPAAGEGRDAKAVPEGKATAKPAPDKPKVPPIAWDGLADRLFEAPFPAGNYAAVASDGKRLWWLETDGSPEAKGVLRSAALDNLGVPPETFMAEVREFAMTPDGRKLAVRKWVVPSAGAGDIFLVDAAPKAPPELAKFQVRLGDWQFPVSPRDEWRQMFADAWRMHRDHFFNRAMNGADWRAVRRKYEPLLERVTDRQELADLMAQMVGEVSALHSQVGAGDVRRTEDTVTPAFLGARFARTAEGARIERIWRADPELVSERSPLAKPEVAARVGETIVSIDGRAVKDVPDLSVLLRDRAGKQVLLAIRGADGALRQAVAVPVAAAQETQLQRSDREWEKRSRVEEASGGRFGYIDLRSMGPRDLAAFAREFYPVADREGLVIDVRGNGGGSIDSIVIEKLLRRAWAYWQTRDGARFWNMQNAFRGRLVVLIDHGTYSDGETFAEGVKRLGLGTVVGRRTAGAGAWLSDRNRLADGGIARAAELGQFGLDGDWLIEGRGVEPDVDVDNLPHASFAGKDTQLDRAIELLRQSLAKDPVKAPEPKPYPAPAARR
ncbi:MAG: PD40 domain-containing protein [Betaproteobacteria bacterium]|nr:PD40 domain-containing protein [Betaproteobacteria bacterium]